MANRIPLIVNPTASQIQELPSGDTLVIGEGGLGVFGSVALGNDSNTDQITLSSRFNSSLIPTDNNRNLGSSSLRWDEVYVNTVTATGTIAATSYTGSGAQLTGIVTVPIGGIIMWGGSVAGVPSGFRLCNGDSLSKSANNNEFLALFNALGYIHGGSGDNFNIPNLRDKFVVGAHADNSDTTYPQIKPGATGGSANAVLVAHNHGVSAHDNDNAGSDGEFPSNTEGTANPDVLTTTTGKDAAGNNSTTQTGTNANLPPYYALSFIIKVS